MATKKLESSQGSDDRIINNDLVLYLPMPSAIYPNYKEDVEIENDISIRGKPVSEYDEVWGLLKMDDDEIAEELGVAKDRER